MSFTRAHVAKMRSILELLVSGARKYSIFHTALTVGELHWFIWGYYIGAFVVNRPWQRMVDEGERKDLPRHRFHPKGRHLDPMFVGTKRNQMLFSVSAACAEVFRRGKR